ncbi:TetR/AcrR family transcriptional regulator [Microbacterium sp. CH-015]|uniref:TetR/AcrR family transcriptional regulator n=1 Tax=Microbacterium sp. CH-015 TaxID=3406734 RepID=UPI003C7786A6
MAFEEKGWRGATFEAIAERAGVTRGALHHHFRDKATLLGEALSWGWGEYADRVFTDTPGSDATSRLEGLLVEYVRLLETDPVFRALASSTVLVAPQAFADTSAKGAGLDDWHTRVLSIVASDSTVTSSLTPAQVAGLVLVLLQGLTVTAVTRPQDLPHSANRKPAIAALVRGVLS